MFLKIFANLLVPSFLFAQVTLLERSYTFESEIESMSEAKKEIQDKAIDQIVEELATETMGEARFAKAKKSLSVKLANKSARFIPFSNITESKQTDKTLKQTLMFKINLTEFRNVLKAIGLTDGEAKSSVRLTFGKATTRQQLDYVLKVLPQVVKLVANM